LLSIDKGVHAGIFFVLTSLLFVGAIKYRQKKSVLFLYCLIGIMYGISLEIMQATCFSNRSADWKDVIANTAGCLAAFLFLKKIRSAVASRVPI
jgi:VanZ family protein